MLPTAGSPNLLWFVALDFMRRVNIVNCSKAGLKQVQETLRVMTERENLPNHYRAVAVRFEK